MLIGTGGLEGRTGRPPKVDRSRRMVLDPLAEVGIRVLVPVRISGSELMVDILGDRKRRERQKQCNQAERQPSREPAGWERGAHRIRIEYHKVAKAVKMTEYSCVFA